MDDSHEKEGRSSFRSRLSHIDWESLYQAAGENGPPPSAASTTTSTIPSTGEVESAEDRDDVAQLMKLADDGDEEAGFEVRRYFRSITRYIKRCGSLGAQAQEELLDSISSENPEQAEIVRRNTASLARELRNRGSSPLIRMAVERVVTAYLIAGALDFLVQSALCRNSPVQSYAGFQEACNRSFLAALEALKVAESIENGPGPDGQDKS